jgi:primary-amine oxidase
MMKKTISAAAARLIAAVGLVVCTAGTPLQAQTVQHPLDPLVFQEYWTVLETLQAAGRLNDETRFSIVTLRQPPKEVVWSWSPGSAFPRDAFAVVRQGAGAFEAVVDLRQRRIVSWTRLEGGQPSWLSQEFGAMVGEVKKHPDFIAAMKRRGISDLTFINCMALPPGYFGEAEQRGRRVAHISCNDVRGVRNTWTREIGGLTAVVDLNARQVLRIVDEGVIPISSVVADYDAASIGPAREVRSPIRVDQPLGPGFQLRGHVVEWQKWQFHVRSDQRVGTVISTVTYDDGGGRRQIMYEAHLSEMFVPYMDPAFGWRGRNFFDVGEFNAGGFTKPVLRGADCPEHAVYLDGIVSTDQGRPMPVPDLLCLFEREAGDVAWRHASEQPESRRKRDLVVRSAAVLGNYDYLFDWTFQQDGSIRVAVGATGIAQVKSTVTARADDAPPAATDGGPAAAADRADAYGRYVDRNLVAVNHDHYFNFRIDLDVDGPNNSFVADRLVTKILPPDNPRRSIWVREPAVARTEHDGMLHMNMERPALWRVTSADRKNHVGYPTSYQLMPGMNAMTLLAADDYARRRAAFIDHHLWVTPYRYEERYAAGDYPTLSTAGQGLPAWTGANRPIEQTDLVLWHTIGMQHQVRAEDWPVMPVVWHSFELRPFDFFNRNPALDLPR